MIINGGTGNGYSVRVTQNNELVVNGTVEDYIGYKSREDEEAFSISSPYPFYVKDTTTSVMVVTNNEQEKDYVVNSLYIGNNGGNSTGSFPILGFLYKNAGLPSNGAFSGDAFAFGNLNLGSTKITSVEAYIWDNSTGANGMDGTPGDTALVQTFGVGLTRVDLQGSLIIAPGQTINILFKGFDSTSLVTLSISGYLQ